MQYGDLSCKPLLREDAPRTAQCEKVPATGFVPCAQDIIENIKNTTNKVHEELHEVTPHTHAPYPGAKAMWQRFQPVDLRRSLCWGWGSG